MQTRSPYVRCAVKTPAQQRQPKYRIVYLICLLYLSANNKNVPKQNWPGYGGVPDSEWHCKRRSVYLNRLAEMLVIVTKGTNSSHANRSTYRHFEKDPFKNRRILESYTIVQCMSIPAKQNLALFHYVSIKSHIQ